jgi:5-(aminomethyl)-3-furanmethanol phosphate kinase
MTSSMVVKVGGSLLARPDLPQSLRRWLRNHGEQQQVNLLIGGGTMIEALRELDRIHRCESAAMHWRCVRALRFTTELVAEWLSEAIVISTTEAFALHRQTWRPGWFLIVPEAFYHSEGDDELPCDWTTTSDSIAALLAHKLMADRLVLLKSCRIERPLDLADAAARGIVDPVLPTLINGAVQVELQAL